MRKSESERCQRNVYDVRRVAVLIPLVTVCCFACLCTIYIVYLCLYNLFKLDVRMRVRSECVCVQLNTCAALSITHKHTYLVSKKQKCLANEKLFRLWNFHRNFDVVG